MAQRDLLIRVVAALDGAGIPYMLTGSLVSSLQGEPRSTHDIDLVVALSAPGVAALVRAFPSPRFLCDADALDRAVRVKGMANLLDTDEGDKVDLWMLTSEPFDQSRFSRRRAVHFLGLEVMVSSPEDTILQKLHWSRLSGGSERQVHDARRVLEVQRDALDLDYLRRWARELDVGTELESLLKSRT